MKKSIFFTLLLCLGYGVVMAQLNVPNNVSVPGSATQPTITYPADYPSGVKLNNIKCYIPFAPVSTVYDAQHSLPWGQVVVSSLYADGLGRPVQRVMKNSAPNGRDAVDINIYDSSGKQVIKLLGYPSLSMDGNFKRDAFSSQASYYSSFPNTLAQGDGTFPYSKTLYDYETAQRTVTEYIPGSTNVGQGRGSTRSSFLNTDPEKIRKWTFVNPTTPPVSTSTCTEFSLYVTESVNENGKRTRVYKDIEGKVILTKTEANTSVLTTEHDGWQCTYSVYDEYGRIRQVITPGVVESIKNSGWNISLSKFNDLCYSYDYDSRSRIISKKLPGRTILNIVYDNTDKPVLVQDGNLGVSNQWLFINYDRLGRARMSGKFLNTAGYTADQLRTILAATTTPSNSFLAFIWSNPNDNPYTISSTLADAEIYNLNYYDNYSNMPSGIAYDDPSVQALPLGTNNVASVFLSQPLGMATVSYSRLMSGNTPLSQWISSVQFYNNQGLPIQVHSLNQKGGHDVVSISYNFKGMPLSLHAVQNNPSASSSDIGTVDIWKIMNYDNQGRMQSVLQKVNNEPAYRKIRTLAYSDLGDKIRSVRYGENAEDQDFKYRIWGALESINKSFCESGSGSNFFGELINYDYGFTNINNIFPSGVQWRMKGTPTILRAYGYKYDDAGRLLDANYNQKDAALSSGWTNTSENYSAHDISYDPNGNITHMEQWGSKPGVSPFKMDDMDYVYKNGNQSNQLESVTDDIKTDFGLGEFTEASSATTDYGYDQNGNATSDANKDITSINYDFNNKPYEINFSSGRSIKFKYDADGTLLSKEILESGHPNKVIDYIGNLEYLDNKLTSISHDEGRVRPVVISLTGGGTARDYEYDYFIKDHLGNVRSVITEEVDNNWWTPVYDPPTKTSTPTLCPTCKPAAGGPTSGNVAGGYTMAERTYSVTNELINATTEEATFDNVAQTRDVKPGSTSASDVNDTRLNEDEGRIIGPSILLPVTAGDKVNINTAAFYTITDGTDYNSNVSAEQLVAGIVEALSGNGGYQTLNEGGVDGQTIANGLSSGEFLSGMQNLKATALVSNQKPQAFLNYLLLDEDMHVVSDQSGFVQTIDAETWNQLVVPEIEAKKTGYLVVFLSNESKMSVHFDNLYVRHYKGKLLEENHYYPYGLTITKKAFVGAAANNNLLSGNFLNRKEFSDLKGLNWYDMGARMYDPQIGRWHCPDPLSEEAVNISPYRYAFNNPVAFTDASGLYEGDGTYGDDDDSGPTDGDAYTYTTTTTTELSEGMYQSNKPHEFGTYPITPEGGKEIIVENQVCAPPTESTVTTTTETSGPIDVVSIGQSDNNIGENDGQKSWGKGGHSEPFVDDQQDYNTGNNPYVRPDIDGYLTLSEANEWWRNGNGERLTVDLNKLNLSMIYARDFSGLYSTKSYNLLLYSNCFNDGLVYGSITLKLYPNNEVRAFNDVYDFDQKSNLNPFNWGRNIETAIANKVAGRGKQYSIKFKGSAHIENAPMPVR